MFQQKILHPTKSDISFLKKKATQLVKPIREIDANTRSK